MAYISTKNPRGNEKEHDFSDDDDDDDDDYNHNDESEDDDDDPGTSWFSEHKAPEKVLHFLTDESFPLAPVNTNTNVDVETSQQKQSQPCILDLGTGNGSMLALLRKGGFTGPMVGVDYSARSVELARELQRLRLEGHHSGTAAGDREHEDIVVATESGTNEAVPISISTSNDNPGETQYEKPEEDADADAVRFEEWDILSSRHALSKKELEDASRPRLDWFPYDRNGFDIVLDKGTFDAVSLSDEVVEDADQSGNGVAVRQRVCERYPIIARRLVRKGGFLVVTSCNWTEAELIRWFTGDVHDGDDDDRLSVWGRIEYPRFRFGGQEGQGVCTVCFKKG